MTRREFLGALGSAAVSAQQDRPNIVYILADDLGWGDLGCYNKGSKIPTPNMDRLASQGMRFTDMHSPSSVCTPTRYGILTGRYCWRSRLKSGVLWGYSPNLIEQGRLTVPAMLKAQDYYTAGAGKWHLGLGSREKVDFSQPLKPGPPDHGFDYYFGIPASLDMDPYVYLENDRTVEQPTAHTEGKNDPRGVFWRPGGIAPSLRIEEVLPTLEKKAIGIIRDRAKSKHPFFLYFALTGPHTPWVPLSQYKGKSGAGIYGDFVAQVDATIGAVMQALEETGLANNTLLILTSDNGAHWTPDDKKKYPHLANAHWRGQKADIWDAGHRIPFIARWPGRIAAGKVSDQLGCLTDLMATVAEITGISLPRNAAEDSYSLAPALLGRRPRTAPRTAIVHHSSEGMFSIRKGEWKLELGLGSGGFSEPKELKPKPGEPPGQLYNLAADPSERNNVYSQNPAIVRELTELLERYRKDGHSRPL